MELLLRSEYLLQPLLSFSVHWPATMRFRINKFILRQWSQSHPGGSFHPTPGSYTWRQFFIRSLSLKASSIVLWRQWVFSLCIKYLSPLDKLVESVWDATTPVKNDNQQQESLSSCSSWNYLWLTLHTSEPFHTVESGHWSRWSWSDIVTPHKWSYIGW